MKVRMRFVLLCLTFILFVGCNAKSGGGGSGIISGHVQVDDEFDLTTTLNKNYLNSEVMVFNLTFPINVTVTGTPYLNLTIGSTTVQANFVSVTNNILRFEYTVQPGDEDSNGISISATLVKNGGSIKYRGTSETSSVINVPNLFSVRVNSLNGLPPVANNISGTINEDTQGIITLSYTDVDGNLASSCSVSGLTNITVTEACACASGVCTVGVTGTANYNGAASFSYTVTANAEASNTATASLTISPVNDPTTIGNITPPDFNEDVQSIITLPYTDVDGNASTCTLSNLSNVTVTTPCACAAGVCTVGVTGTPQHYYGPGSFDFTITQGGVTSSSASASFNILSVLDAPTTANLTPPSFNEDTQSIITLTHTVVGGDTVTSCAISGVTNVTVTQGCSCSAGVCTVGVTGTANYNGAASFNWTVSAGTATSTSRSATLTILSVDDVVTTANMTPANFNEDVQSIITLNYTDIDGAATACSVTNLSNVNITQACACVSGVCTVGVTGTPLHYNGSGSFDFNVTSNGVVSNTSAATLTINSVSDAPTTANLTPASFNEDTQSIITLTHTVVGADTATSCAVSGLTNVTVTQACACVAGVCTVGVTGTANYFGSASFNWTVSAGTATSVSRSATLTILSVDDAATLGAIATQNTNKSTATGAIAFTFTDNDGAVCSAARLSMTSSNTSIVANGSVTWGGTAPNCTAVITPVAGATGTTAITFTATDGGLANKTTTFNLNVNGVTIVWTDTSNVEITTYSFGTPGTNTTATVRVRNIGNQTSSAVVITDDAGTIRLSQTNACGTLAAGATCDVTLNWTETGGGGNGFRSETYTATVTGSSSSLTASGTK